MRLLFIILILMGFSVFSYGQQVKAKDVPENVRNAFRSAYPQTGKVSWEKEGQHFEAEFKRNGKETSVLLNKEGKLLETEEEWDTDDLPNAVIETLNSQFAGYEVEESEKITYPDGSVAYEVELENDEDQSLEVLINENGEIKSQSSEEDDEDDEDDDDQ